MKTNLKIRANGEIFCYTGVLVYFLEDIVNYICPMIETYMTAVFNDKTIIVRSNDTVDSLLAKYRD